MRSFFDSSALVPVFYADDPRHTVSKRAFLSGAREESFCALHTFGEVYAVLTGLPIRPRIRGPEGIDILRQIMARLTPVSLTNAEYIGAIEAVAATVVGGTIYDAIIARCAVKAGAEILLTWNQRHFTRFPEVSGWVMTPAELPIVE